MSAKDIVTIAAGVVNLMSVLVPQIRDIVLKPIQISVGLIICALIGYWGTFETGKRLGSREGNRSARLRSQETEAPEPKRKLEIVKFKDTGVQYVVEVTNEGVRANTYLPVSSPQCLTHGVSMSRRFQVPSATGTL